MLSEVQQYCPTPIHGPEFQQFFATLPLTVSALVYSTRISTEKKDPVPLFSVPEPSRFKKKRKERRTQAGFRKTQTRHFLKHRISNVCLS